MKNKDSLVHHAKIFKQKTAYEIFTLLEFRRVLFRSAFAVADEYQQRGIGSALAAELVADARAAGITEITALVSSDNPRAVAVLRRIAGALDVRPEGPELSVRAALA